MLDSAQPLRFRADDLRAFALALLDRAGVRVDIARDVAKVLVDGDLLGHTTHGLALLAPYLAEIDAGRMAKSGEAKLVRRRAAAETWDGDRLPGPWLTRRGVERACAMARDCGTGSVVIRRSHHIACLAAYLQRATEQGLALIIECSDPTVAAVAPHGGRTPLITPNPLAAGLPTSGDPILIDVSMSITSMGYVRQQMEAGNALPGTWLIDHLGRETSDPAALFTEPKGALLPLGGIDAGHKGFGLGILVEAMTGALAGHGRADQPEGWGASVFIQALDPEAFGGLEAFRREIDHLVAVARASAPRTDGQCVRLPGERGLSRYREQVARGIALYPTILPALRPWADRYSVALPSPCAG
ncbi:MAG TPA: Ldh family oxidoreductase [Casimicrobiaceae bacterium]|nr:Ldh family oxidoreductase [Casimicrobiaceae bacterium]